MGRVFARLGEKKNRNKAPVSNSWFKNWASTSFRRLGQGRSTARDAARPGGGRTYFDGDSQLSSTPTRAGNAVRLQLGLRQQTRRVHRRLGCHQRLRPAAGLVTSVATITCPLGDLSVAHQTRALADLSEKYAGGNARTHGRTKYRPPLGARQDQVVEPLQRPAEALGLATPGAGSDRRRHQPAPAPTPASWASPPAADWAGELRERLAVESSRPRSTTAVKRPADQSLRLLQQLRPAPRGRHRLLRQQPQRRQLHRPPLPGDARRHVARERRQLRPGHGGRAEQADPRAGDGADRPVRRRAGRRRDVSGLVQAGRQEGAEDDRRPVRPRAGPQGRRQLLHRLGRPPRVHHRRPRHRRVRGRGRHAPAVRPQPGRGPGVRGPSCCSTPANFRRPTSGPTRPCSRPPRRWCRSTTSTCRTPPTRS